MLAYAGACSRAGKRDGRRREGHRFGSLELVGCLERRLLPPLQILQWGCGRVAAPAALQPLPVPKARRRYTNLTVWLPPHVRSAASGASPPPPSPLRRRRLRRLRRLGRHSFRRHCRTPPPPPTVAPLVPSSCQPPQHRRPLTKPLHPAPTRAAQSVATALLPVLLRHFWSVVALCFVVELALGL